MTDQGGERGETDEQKGDEWQLIVLVNAGQTFQNFQHCKNSTLNFQLWRLSALSGQKPEQSRMPETFKRHLIEVDGGKHWRTLQNAFAAIRRPLSLSF